MMNCDNKSEVCTKKDQSDVKSALDKLEGEISNIDTTIQKLRDGLAPILKEETGKEPLPIAECPTSVPIGKMVYVFTNRLNDIRDQINDLTDRLGV